MDNIAGDGLYVHGAAVEGGGHGGGGIEQLVGAGPGLFQIAAANVLGSDDHAAGGQGTEERDKKQKQLIH